MNHLRKMGLAAAAGAVAVTGVLAGVPANSFFIPGTPGKDVHAGLDNDNADNPFVQPPGVAAKQHMDNTDIIFGRDNDDLLIGNLGDDALLGGYGSDILIGGPEGFTAPNSDVLFGEEGDDINIWAPGDGSDAFLGDKGYDTMVFAPFVKKPNGKLLLTKSDKYKRKIPHVKIDASPQFSCTIVKVPAKQKLGFDFLVRFNVNDVPAVTVRQASVEKVYCPSPDAGKALVADLTVKYPEFKPVKLAKVKGVTGEILAPVA